MTHRHRSSYDGLASYIQWFVASGRIRHDAIHVSVVQTSCVVVDRLLANLDDNDCAEAIKWCEAAICLCQQAGDRSGTETFLARKLKALLSKRDFLAARRTASDFKSFVNIEVVIPNPGIIARSSK